MWPRRVAPWIHALIPFVASAFALALAAGAAGAAPPEAPAAKEKPAVAAALVPEITYPDCAGGVRAAAAAGSHMSCPRLDLGEARQTALDLPEEDFPGWLGRATGWWGDKSAEAAPRSPNGWVVAPTISASPLIGVGFGVAAAGTIQLSKDPTTRPSKYATSFVVTTNSQFSIPLRTDVTLPGGEWNLVGVWQWSKFPAPTWGLGGNTPDSAETTIDRSTIRVHETANRRIVADLFAGLGIYLDYHYGITDRGTASGAPSAFSQYPFGTGANSFSFGPGVNLLWDSRDDAGNATHGSYANFNYSFVPTWLGSATRWQSTFLDLRTYVPLHRRLVLGLWSYAWFAFGDIPYLELPAIGSDPDGRSGRGYTEGRHIGKSLVYGEAELRYAAWKWLGVVAAVNVHSAGEPEAKGIFPDTPRFQYWYPAIVAGARIALVRQSRSNVALDLAWGKASHGIYVNFGETF